VDWGNDIFDAISGAPGTYLSLDMYGNLGFGFSTTLWQQTYALVEMLTQPKALSDPGVGYIQTTQIDFLTGLTTYVKDFGTYSETSGVIPEYFTALSNLTGFISQNENAVSFMIMGIKLGAPPTSDPALLQFEALTQALYNAAGDLALALEPNSAVLVTPAAPVLKLPTNLPPAVPLPASPLPGPPG
jgi:hypothetical protein